MLRFIVSKTCIHGDNSPTKHVDKIVRNHRFYDNDEYAQGYIGHVFNFAQFYVKTDDLPFAIIYF